jgi:hypothetical protein
MAQVDKVTVVRKYMPCSDPHLMQVRFKGLNTFFGEGFGMPLALVFGEQGEGSGTYFCRIQWCVFHSARCAYMGSNVFQEFLLRLIRH